MITIIYLAICLFSPISVNLGILAGTMIWDFFMWTGLIFFALKQQQSKLKLLDKTGDLSELMNSLKAFLPPKK